jgi:hypothetical protein
MTRHHSADGQLLSIRIGTGAIDAKNSPRTCENLPGCQEHGTAFNAR